MAVYFKFKSAKDFDSVSIDGHFISVANLKDKIVEQKKLGRGSDYDLVISNAQTNEGVHFCLRSRDRLGHAAQSLSFCWSSSGFSAYVPKQYPAYTADMYHEKQFLLPALRRSSVFFSTCSVISVVHGFILFSHR